MFYTIVSRTIITKINTPRDYFYIFLLGSVGYIVLHWYLHMDKREGIVEKVREYLYYAMVIDIITTYLLMVFYPVKSDKKDIEDTQKQSDENEPEYTPEQKRAIMQRAQEARRLQHMRQKELVERSLPPVERSLPLVEQRGKEGGQKSVTNENTNENMQNVSGEQKVESLQDQNDIKNEEKSESDPKRSIFTKSDDSDETDADGNNDHNDDHNDNHNDNKVDNKTIKKESDNKKSSKNRSNEEDKIKVKKKDTVFDTDIPVYEGQKKRNKTK